MTERCGVKLRRYRGVDPVCGRQLGHPGRHLSEQVWQRKHLYGDPEKAHQAHLRATRKHYHGNKTYYQQKHLQREYGLSLDDVEQMRDAQGGACAACRVGPAEFVDHDHASGRVRALLCRQCNTAAGLLNDDPERLRMLAEYLTRHRIS